MTRLFVKLSSIHGKGLFTHYHISEHDLIAVFEQRPATPSELASDHPHVIENLGVMMLGKHKYINHSDEPNVELYDDGRIIAIRDIEPGQEILSDYGPYFSSLYSKGKTRN
jgi:uncharacterized protein